MKTEFKSDEARSLKGLLFNYLTGKVILWRNNQALKTAYNWKRVGVIRDGKW